MPPGNTEETLPGSAKNGDEHGMEPKALASRWNTGSGPFPMLSYEANLALTSSTSRGRGRFAGSFRPFSPLSDVERALERRARKYARKDRLRHYSDRRADWLDKWQSVCTLMCTDTGE